MNLKLLFVVALIIAWTMPVRAAGGADWWNDDWRYRVEVQVDRSHSHRPVDTGWSRFPILEQGCHPRGHDVRVIDDSGRPRPMKLMFFEPSLYGIVSFALKPNDRHLWIYFGNPEVNGPPEPWRPRAGLLLATYRAERNGFNNWDDFNKTIDQSPHAWGAAYVRRIFHGYNPLGPSDRYLSMYNGWLLVVQPGIYHFCTASDEASFMWIDDQRVCQWPGHHGPNQGRRGEHSGKIELEPGIHRIRYLHGEWTGGQATVAAWRPPGHDRYEVIPPDRFVPILECPRSGLEVLGSDLAADFSAFQNDWLQLDGNSYLLYTLYDLSHSAGSRIVEHEWRFEDGQVLRGRQVKKMFFESGDHRVDLHVRDAHDRTAETHREIRIHPIDHEGARKAEDVGRAFAQFLASSPPAGLGLAATIRAVHLLTHCELYAHAAELYKTAIERSTETSGRMINEAIEHFVVLMTERLDKPEKAVEYLERQQERRQPADPTAVQIFRLLSQIEVHHLDRPESGLEHARNALEQWYALHPDQARAERLNTMVVALSNRPSRSEPDTTSLFTYGEANVSFSSYEHLRRLLERPDEYRGNLRRLLVTKGDAHRAMQQRSKAVRAYETAEHLVDFGINRQYMISTFTLETEAYLRDGKYDWARQAIDLWLDMYPTERLVGYGPILRARWLAQTSKPRAAERELLTLLGCEPQGAYDGPTSRSSSASGIRKSRRSCASGWRRCRERRQRPGSQRLRTSATASPR